MRPTSEANYGDRARQFYRQQALTGGWTTRQLRRQIATQFYERANADEQDAVLLAQAQIVRPESARHR